jgi:hypothetical protein
MKTAVFAGLFLLLSLVHAVVPQAEPQGKVSSNLHYVTVHHGPGMRGYDTNRGIVISGVILRCWEDVRQASSTDPSTCTDGYKGHGVLRVRVDSVVWDVTLPSTPELREAKVSMGKLKPETAVTVWGVKHQSKANDMYANEIIVNGVSLFKFKP